MTGRPVIEERGSEVRAEANGRIRARPVRTAQVITGLSAGAGGITVRNSLLGVVLHD